MSVSGFVEFIEILEFFIVARKLVDFGGRTYMNTCVQNLPADEATMKKVNFDKEHKSST